MLHQEVNRFPGLAARGGGDTRVKAAVLEAAWCKAARVLSETISAKNGTASKHELEAAALQRVGITYAHVDCGILEKLECS